MHNAYVVTGTLTRPDVVALDEALPLCGAKVRLVIDPVLSASKRPYLEVVAPIRERQARRNHQPPSREQVEAYLASEREAWETSR